MPGLIVLRSTSALWVIVLLSSPALAMAPRSNETGMVRVLYIGDHPTALSPYRFMVQDPFLDMTPVKASRVVYESDIIRKSIRVYILMVRRRAFREVGATRLRQADNGF